MSKLIVLDHTGHTEVEFDAITEQGLEAANKLFTDMVKAGYIAYAIRGEEKKDKVIIYDFNQEESEIVMTPMLRGG